MRFTVTEVVKVRVPPPMRAKSTHIVRMGRLGEVDEMAVLLASTVSSHVTAQTIHVDGGTAAAAGWYHHYPETASTRSVLRDRARGRSTNSSCPGCPDPGLADLASSAAIGPRKVALPAPPAKETVM